MPDNYQPDNIFARILRGELPCDKVYENSQVLAFRDINPQAPVHILVIPKGAYANDRAFANNASEAEMAALWRGVDAICAQENITGYRLIVNHGKEGGQEVPHLHIHILSGKPLGPMVSS